MRGILVRLAIIAIIGLGAFALSERIPGSARSLVVGDCFDVPAEQRGNGIRDAGTEDVRHVSCTEGHRGEVVYVGNHPAPAGAAPPTDDELESFVLETCGGAMISYVGGLQDGDANAELQNLDLGWIHPTDEGWSDGDRRITCYLHSVDGSQLTRPFRATP